MSISQNIVMHMNNVMWHVIKTKKKEFSTSVNKPIGPSVQQSPCSRGYVIDQVRINMHTISQYQDGAPPHAGNFPRIIFHSCWVTLVKGMVLSTRYCSLCKCVH